MSEFDDLVTLGIDLFLVAFVILKLMGIIDWSWWWVFSPVWIPLGLIIILWALAALIAIREEI